AMDEGCAQIVVAPVGGMVIMVVIVIPVPMVMVVIVIMPMVMSVVVLAAQQPSACEVDEKAEECNRDGLVEGDRDRPEQPFDGLIGDQQRDHGEHDGTRERRQVPELTSAEGEAMIVGVAAGINGGGGRDGGGAREGGAVQGRGGE